MGKRSKAVICREWISREGNEPVVVETVTVESPKRRNPTAKIIELTGGGARLLNLCEANRSKLDELVAAPYEIEDVSRAFEDMQNGVDARGVISM